MAKDNLLNNIGDVLTVMVNPQISGKITLDSYSDVIIGETDTRKLLREFRISSNELFWSDWLELNNENLLKKQYVSENSLFIEVRYTRTGTDTTSFIEFQNIYFYGNRQEITFSAPTISSSIFSNIIGGDYFKILETNIFKKLYYRGIIPKYITRGDNSNEDDDKDYIDLFFSLARFFSLFICFFKRFETFKDDIDLMREQVRQYNIYFDESNITLSELKYLAANIYNEIRKRGTEMIFKREGETLLNGKEVPINGEFIRLLRNKKSDELLYESVPLNKTGFCLGQSSPLYRGTCQAENLNKTKEKTQDFQNLSNFILNSQGSTSSYLLINYDNKKVLNLKTDDGTVSLGRINSNQDVRNNIYVADSRMDYEITFSFKIVSGQSDNVRLLFGVEGFDILKNKIIDSFVTPNGDSISETFFEKDFSNLRNDCWYYVRGIIHSYSSSNLDENKTNLGWGNNLYFNNSFVKYILPKIQLISDGINSELNIWDYKIRPLVRGTNILPLKDGSMNSHSLGFIQSSRLFYTYVRNNNNSQSKDDITDIIEKYLYPFDSTDIFVFMSNF